jgi:phenylpropionate dioxygenase-like ring-hydroxylating dioxygenase large terminal subunit
MLKSIEARLRTEINDCLDRGVPASLTNEEMLNPIAEYIDDGRLVRERQQFFLRSPMILCHLSEIAEPNSYFAEEIIGVPVLAVRQKDGSVKVFLNVCRHRGVNVVANGTGKQSVFVCQFHAWSYRSDGTLVNIPHKEGFEGIDRSCYGLTELPVEVRHGLVWIILTPGTPINIKAYLGALDEEVASYNLGNMVPIQRHFLEGDLNWKLAIDGFLETYHVQALHRQTIDPYLRSNFGVFEAIGQHGRMVTTKRKIDEVRKLPYEQWELLPYIGVVYQLFPHNLLLWQGGDRMTYWTSYSTNDPNKSISRVSIMAPPETAHKTEKWNRNWDLTKRTVLDEDFMTAAAAQKSFHTGAQTHIVFGRNEPALQHFHRRLAEVLGPVS